jgi:O-antigen/teichoic acid export membrane protein
MRSSLRARAVEWIAWATVSRLGRDGLHVVCRLILARLLWPEAFGLFTLAFAIAAAFEVLCLLQFESALVQRPDLTPGARATAHWTLTVGAAVGALALLLLAGPLADGLGNASLTPLVQALGGWLVLTGLGAAPRATLWRELAFRRLAIAGLAAQAVAAVVAVAAALAGAGIASLVVHVLVAEAVELVFVWSMVTWRPSLHWRRREFLDLLRFGGPLIGRRAVDYLVGFGDRLLVGYGAGPAALGLYAVALRLMRTVTEPVGGIFSRVAFPAFARTREDLVRTQRGLYEAHRAQVAVTLPLLVAVVLLAGDLVPALLGRAWVGSVALMQLLAVRTFAGSVMVLPRALLLGRGRQWLLLALGLVGLALYGSGWTLGLRWGPWGVAAGGAAAAVVMVPVTLAVLRREIPFRYGPWILALVPGAAAAATLALGVLVAERALAPALGAGPRGRLLLMVAGGAVGAGVTLLPWLHRQVRRHQALSREAADLAEAPGEAVPR